MKCSVIRIVRSSVPLGPLNICRAHPSRFSERRDQSVWFTTSISPVRSIVRPYGRNRVAHLGFPIRQSFSGRHRLIRPPSGPSARLGGCGRRLTACPRTKSGQTEFCPLLLARQRSRGVLRSCTKALRGEKRMANPRLSGESGRAEMKRSFFMVAAATASAISISRPLLARSEDLTKLVRVATNREASGWREPIWSCGSAVVWLDSETGIYYYKGDRSYGRTKRGAYTCEKEAIKAGNRACPDG